MTSSRSASRVSPASPTAASSTGTSLLMSVGSSVAWAMLLPLGIAVRKARSGKAAADPKDQIGVLQKRMPEMLADADAAGAERQRMVLGKGALASRSVVMTGASSSSAERLQLRPRLGVVDALAGDDDRALGRDQRLGDLRDRLRVGAALQPRRLLVFGDERVRHLLAQEVGRELDQHRARAAVLDRRKGAAQRLDRSRSATVTCSHHLVTWRKLSAALKFGCTWLMLRA